MLLCAYCRVALIRKNLERNPLFNKKIQNQTWAVQNYCSSHRQNFKEIVKKGRKKGCLR